MPTTRQQVKRQLMVDSVHPTLRYVIPVETGIQIFPEPWHYPPPELFVVFENSNPGFRLRLWLPASLYLLRPCSRPPE